MEKSKKRFSRELTRRTRIEKARGVAADLRRGAQMKTKFEELVAQGKAAPFTPDDKEAQRRSFAYGNVKIENDQVTREMVDREAERLILE